MAVSRWQVDLTGFSGAPGINTWFMDDGWAGGGDAPEQAGLILADLRAFYQAQNIALQSDVVCSFLPQVALLDEDTGELVNVVTADTTPATVTGGGTDPASHATMIKLRVQTGTFSDGREIRGGIFFGPVQAGVIEANGDVTPSVGTSIAASLSTLASAVSVHGAALGVYRRPREAAGTTPARAGQFAAAVGYGIFPRPAVLRSRRD